MGQILHANARTTEATRREIRNSYSAPHFQTIFFKSSVFISHKQAKLVARN